MVIIITLCGWPEFNRQNLSQIELWTDNLWMNLEFIREIDELELKGFYIGKGYHLTNWNKMNINAQTIACIIYFFQLAKLFLSAQIILPLFQLKHNLSIKVIILCLKIGFNFARPWKKFRWKSLRLLYVDTKSEVK